MHVWHAAARGPWLLRTKESKQGISIVKSHPCTGDAREGARSAPFLLTAQWIPFGDHPMKLDDTEKITVESSMAPAQG